MSFQQFYQEELLLLDKTIDTPTTITEGQVEDGDLTPFRHRIELVNTGNQLQNNGILTIRIPPDGTFVRKEPILIDENAKDRFLIQAQISQDRDKDGIVEEVGKLFRFTIGIPSLQDDEHVGETLKIQLIPVEYRTRETIDAERLRFFTFKGVFERRALAYNENKGADEPALLFTTGSGGSIALPDETVRLDWREFAPKPTHDLFRKIIDRLAEPTALGGVFEDHFFDYEGNSLSTRTIDVKAEAEGTIDRGVIIDPLLVDTADTEKDKTINVDLIKFKNNVITQGSPIGGSLPMETTKFASAWEHGKQRDEWDPTRDYFDGVTTANTNTSTVRRNDSTLGILRFFRSNSDSGPSSPAGAVDPIGQSPHGDTVWEEDFTITPPFNRESEYQQGDVVTITTLGRDIFFKAIEFIDKQEDAPGVNPKWGNTGIDFLSGVDNVLIGGAPTANAGRRNFFSYTPWTADFHSMRVTTLFGIQDSSTESQFTGAGYQGLVPDFNYVRANFDRVEADNRFEQRTLKDVIRLIQDSSQVPNEERYLGARYLIDGVGIGQFSGHDNQIAEWNSQNAGQDFPVAGNPDRWAFSLDPEDGDTIVDQATGHMYSFDQSSDSWEILWDIFTTPTAITGGTRGVRRSAYMDSFADASRPSPLHICKDIRLTNGSSGIPAQAFELRFDFSPIDDANLGIFNGDPKNVNSRGAWWFMQFPYPKYNTTPPGGSQINIGDIYRNPTLDTENLDRNSKGRTGWNRGLDSEDLGRIQRMSGKYRLSLFGSLFGVLTVGFSDMAMKGFAVDIFDRVWHTDFKLRRNGEYQFIQLSFGEQAQQQLHYNRIDELLEVFGIVLDADFFLREKEFTGIEFDWRFVKSLGIFWNAPYNTQGFYFAHQMPNYVTDYLSQFGMQILPSLLSAFDTGGNPNDVVVNDARLAIDEFRFEKQLYANSDDEAVADARTVQTHLTEDPDYINVKQKAIADRERAKFVHQAWFMKAHGDVRMRFGEKFLARGSRVPTSTGEQELICNEVKHIIDSDGYMIEFTGKRKFIFG